MLGLDKKKTIISQGISRFRSWIQAGAALLTNVHLPNFLSGRIYQGDGKAVCVPGLNCYSCPAASGACPIGSFQAVVGSSKFSFSYYITGFLILFGVLLGRFICGFLCPFGWFQDLLHRIPGKKLSTKKLKPLTYLKYVVLLLTVCFLPVFAVNDVGMGDPFFCKYICPQGVLEGAIPLSVVNKGIRSALGTLFTWKLVILIIVIVLSVLFYRPFCKWICPLGAFYACGTGYPCLESGWMDNSVFPVENVQEYAKWMWRSPKRRIMENVSGAASASTSARSMRSAFNMALADRKNNKNIENGEMDMKRFRFAAIWLQRCLCSVL